MRDGLKILLVLSIVGCQGAFVGLYVLRGIVSLTALGVGAASVLVLLLLLIRERIQERKEEERHDYRDY